VLIENNLDTLRKLGFQSKIGINNSIIIQATEIELICLKRVDRFLGIT